MGRQTWLADCLRAAGLTVHEVSGWKTRGSATFEPRGIMCHETRGSIRSTDAGEIHVLLNGSQTAPPPIAQLYLSRTGHWHVIAAGRCNHVRTGWAGPFKGVGNTGLLGIEAQHALGEPWTDRQYDSYVRGVAALKKRTGWGVAGHKEHQPGGYGHASVKTDPSFNMNTFRRDVADMISKGPGVSKEQVVDGLRTAQPFQSAGVGAWAKSGGWGNVSQRALAEYTWEQVSRLAALLGEIRTGQAAILAAVNAGGDHEAVMAEIRAQGDQTRAALLAHLGEIAPGLAASVVEHLGPEAQADQIGEAIARELAMYAAAGAAGAAGVQAGPDPA